MAENNMTKEDLIIEVARREGIRQSDIRRVVQTMLDTITDSLGRGERVSIYAFGVFYTRLWKLRWFGNPITGEREPIPARWTAMFRPFVHLGRAVGTKQPLVEGEEDDV